MRSFAIVVASLALAALATAAPANVEDAAEPAVVEEAASSEEPSEQASADGANACLTKLEGNLHNLVMPERVAELTKKVRELNPQYAELTLTKLVDTEGAEFDLVKAGLMRAEDQQPYVEDCATFITQLSEIIENTDCGTANVYTITDSAQENYATVAAEHEHVDSLIGHARVCLTL